MNPTPEGDARPGESAPPPEQQGQQPAAAPPGEEEQMKRFEEALKEADWGHQPC